MSMKVLGDRVVVRPNEEVEMSQGGIYLPGSAQETPQQGTVKYVGQGKMLETGEVRPVNVKPGDKVIFGKYSGTKMKIDAEELLFMREEDIMAVIE